MIDDSRTETGPLVAFAKDGAGALYLVNLGGVLYKIGAGCSRTNRIIGDLVVDG